jgi:hypothetical protein
VKSTVAILIIVSWFLLGRGADAGSLSLEVHEIGTKETFHSNWESDWGSYDRDYALGKRILVTLHDLSRKVASCDVSVYFVAQPVFGGGRFIYDRREFTPQFRSRIEVSGPVDSVDLMASVQHYATLRATYGRGARMDGWIVVAKTGLGVFDIKASSQTLLEIAQESPRQTESLKKMIVEYETATKRR